MINYFERPFVDSELPTKQAGFCPPLGQREEEESEIMRYVQKRGGREETRRYRWGFYGAATLYGTYIGLLTEQQMKSI